MLAAAPVLTLPGPCWVPNSPELGWWHVVQVLAQLCCDRASQLWEGGAWKSTGKFGDGSVWVKAAEGKAQWPLGPAEQGQEVLVVHPGTGL